MTKTIVMLIMTILLTSCGMTQEERQDYNNIKKENCEELGFGYYMSSGWIYCARNKRDKVMDCIEEYTEGLDQKYNNPDTVSNLSEDNYSDVVRTCNEIFGK